MNIAMTNPMLLISAIAAAVFLFTLGVAYLVAWANDPVRRKLGALSPNIETSGSWIQRLRAVLEQVARYALPSNEKEKSKIERKLAHAGFRSAGAATVFYGMKTSLAIIFGIAWLAASTFFPQLTSSHVIFIALGAGFFGLVLPDKVLSYLMERRQKSLRHAFPDAMDMLVVCVESGLGLSAALQRVADELEVSHPELASELSQVTAETRAGLERETALRNLAERTGLDDIRGLVGLLVQTLRFGTSVADSLRVYSEEFRDKRMQKAEEQAAKIGTKLIFPLVLCLFPGFFIVAIGPAVLKLIEAFSHLK